MIKLDLKLRKKSKSIDLTELNVNSIKIKFKIKGIYKNTKFKAEISFKLFIINDEIKIRDLTICDLDIYDSESSDSSDSSGCNPYMLNIDEKFCDKNNIKKIYKEIKNFIKSIKITQKNNLIDLLTFNLNNKLKKINIKGYIRTIKK